MPLRFTLDLAELGHLLHSAVADRVGEDLAGNVPVIILGRLAADGPLRPVELMSATGLTSGGMTKAVDRLVVTGLVVRSPDPSDGRGVLVELSPGGRDAVRQIDEALAEALDRNADATRKLVSGLLDSLRATPERP